LSDVVDLLVLEVAKARRAWLEKSDTAALEAFYEDFFDQKDNDLYERDPRMRLRRDTIREALARYVPAGGRALDVGCGLGDVLSDLPPSYERFGVDYSEGNVRRAKARLGADAHLQQASIFSLPFDNAQFDLCLCLEVLEHVEDDEKAVSEIQRVLRPGGYVIASVPYAFYWPQYKRLIGHYRHYDHESFKRLLRQAQLEVVASLPNYPEWHRRYMRHYLAARVACASAGRLGGSDDVYDFKLPGQERPWLDTVAMRLEPLRCREAKMGTNAVATNTFLVARKAADGC
jgi:SAM-dependent methyltransferase